MNDLPRLAHVQSHVPPRCREWIEPLLAADDLDGVAAAMGPGYTRRMAESASDSLKMVYLPERLSFHGPIASIMARFTALRVAAGIEPCWCELSTAYPQEYSGEVRHLVGNPATGHKHASENGGSPARHPTKEGGAPVTLLRAAR